MDTSETPLSCPPATIESAVAMSSRCGCIFLRSCFRFVEENGDRNAIHVHDVLCFEAGTLHGEDIAGLPSMMGLIPYR